MSSSSDSKTIAKELSQLKKAMVFCHVFPDADAIGSAGGMTLGLIAAGIEAELHLAEDVPERLKGLVAGVPLTDQLPSSDCALVVVDTANKARVAVKGDVFPEKASKVFNIDHHISNPGWGEINLIKGYYPSASCIVLEILEELGITLSEDILNLLYAGLLEDTGSFRFSNATPIAFESAARMVGLGASPEKVANLIYFNVPERVVKLRGIAIPEISKKIEGQIGWLVVTNKMLEQAGAVGGDTEGLVDEVRALSGVKGSVMIREREGSWKVSLRSKIENLDVNNVAQALGGGGHRAAAGITLEGDLEVVEKKVLDGLKKELAGA